MTGLSPGGDDPERRILNDVGSDSGFLAFADVSNTDLLFLVPALIVAMVTLEMVVILTGRFFVGVALALTILGIAGAYVHVCPDHRTPLGLITSFVTHHRRKNTKTLTNITADTSTDTSPDARELTRVLAVEPEADAIRRQDETLVGAVRIDPANLALADHDQWNRAARGFGAVLNALDYPVQIHSSARRVDPDRMTAAYEDRRTDPDVRSTPVLTEIVEVYRRRRPQEFRERGTSVRQYHAIVPVAIQEVSLEENAWVSRLQSIPIIGSHLGSVVADVLLRDERCEAIEERQRAILRERRTNLTEQLTSIEDVTARPVTATALVTLVEEYWSGSRTEYPDADPHLRMTPVVMSDHDTDVSHSSTDTTDSAATDSDRT